MRYGEIIAEKVRLTPAVKALTDAERWEMISFIVNWIGGSHMSKADISHVAMWEKIAALFPPKVTGPMRLFRVVTLPIEYADKDEFHLERPAPGPIGSWTSTKVGLDTVAGIATDFAEKTPGLAKKTCRIAIAATIEPQDILMTIGSLKEAFLTLIHDYDAGNAEEYWKEEHPQHGTVMRSRYKTYLGSDDQLVLNELGYLWSLFIDYSGGPYRQSEHIIRTRPLDVKKILTYRVGERIVRYGNDDPHN